jgi:DNA-binding NtrC family response regulator
MDSVNRPHRESGLADGTRQPHQKHPASVLVVDDEYGMRHFLQRALAKECAHVEVADSVETAEQLRRRCNFDLLVVDLRLPRRSGMEWLQELRAQGVDTDVIFMTGHADLESSITALRIGAADFILKPFRIEQLLSAVRRCLDWRHAEQEVALGQPLERLSPLDGIVGRSPAMKELCARVRRVAGRASTVLVEGESGTGKEVVARCLHRYSGRKGELVAVNCGSIAAELLESELFGHTKGAFTGAQRSRVGLFSHANGGTLFLDEIGEMPLAMQAKLLRVLEERVVRPVGSDHELPVDVRIVAATNRNLAEAVASGAFREDLYYRLNVLRLVLPPLRERPGDIPDLVEHFSEAIAAELCAEPLRITAEDVRRLQDYSWPGNVRELRNVVERALLLGESPADCIEPLACGEPAQVQPPTPGATAHAGSAASLSLDEVEKRHILQVLRSTSGNKSEAARQLGVSRKTLERKMKIWAGSE